MRTLIVEDQPNLLAYLKRALEEQGHAVDVAANGQDALDWAEAVRYDLIILDIMLPRVDGLTVCRRLRSGGCQASILMLTAKDTVDDRVAGLDIGADDYLIKPFELKELLARIRAVCRRHVGKQSVMQVGDLTLDIHTRMVRRGSLLINLTNKEYSVLECLIREPDRILTRTEIAEYVWNYDVYNQSNVVDVYIRNLRRKIDDDFDSKLIHTVRGAGYRLSAEDASA